MSTECTTRHIANQNSELIFHFHFSFFIFHFSFFIFHFLFHFVYRIFTLVIAVVLLSTIHNSPMLILLSCACLNGAAAYLQNQIAQVCETVLI